MSESNGDGEHDDMVSIEDDVPEEIDNWPFEFQWGDDIYQVIRPNPAWVQERIDESQNPQQGGISSTEVSRRIYNECFTPKDGAQNDKKSYDELDYDEFPFITELIGKHFLRPVMGGR